MIQITDTIAIDSQIVTDIHQSGTYHLVQAVPFQDGFGTGQVQIWAYLPGQAGHEGNHGHG